MHRKLANRDDRSNAEEIRGDDEVFTKDDGIVLSATAILHLLRRAYKLTNNCLTDHTYNYKGNTNKRPFSS